MKVVISKKFSFHLNKVDFGPIFARKKFLVIMNKFELVFYHRVL